MAVRWGLIGCGDIARKRVGPAMVDDPDSQLVAACRRDETKLAEFCSEFKVKKSYTRSDELLNDPDIDAVYIATPVNLHLPQTIAAAESGKHVLVEKPMAMSVAECDQMIAACRAAGVKLGVAYYRRFYPVVDRIMQLIHDDAIGKPLAVSVTTAAAFAISPGQDGYWRVIPEQGGGGAVMDIGSHRINLMLSVFGDISTVKAICGTVAADYDAEDCASLVLQFASGMQGTLQCFFGGQVDPDEFSIIGTRGRLTSAPLNDGELIVHTREGRRVESHPPHANFNSPQIADFVAAIRDNRPPTVDGEEGRATNAVIERAYADDSSSR